jgi:large subunit ribosomal protein L13
MIRELDATNQSLGRLASRIAMMLRAKDTAGWTPNIIPDVEVVVHNLDKIVFKGTKLTSTKYYRHSGYPGGVHEKTLEQMWKQNKEKVLRMAVRGMLPVNRQRDKLLQHITVK